MMRHNKSFFFLFWGALCISVFFLSVGYSTLNTTLLVESSGTVEGEPTKGNSMYSWQDFPMMDANIDATIQTLKELNVTTVYHSFLDSDFTNGNANRIISKMSLNGIKVYHVMGSPAWYTSKDYVVPAIDQIYNYNLSVKSSSELITGIVFDIEPYLLDEFLNDQITEFIRYSNTMVDVSNYMRAHDLKTGIAIPSWYDVYTTDNVSFTEEENARAKTALENLIKSVDMTSIMNYTKEGMVENIAGEVAIAKEFNANIESIIEFHRPAGDEVPENVTVWGEDDPLQYTKSQWDAMSERYDYENLTFSYHYLECILERLDKYERVQIEVLRQNNQVIRNGNVVIRFNNGETLTRAIGESNVLPKAVNYTIYYPGYYLTTFQDINLGDRRLRRRYKLTDFDKYTFEIYPRVLQSGDGDYTDIQTGTIRMVDVIYGEVYEQPIKLGYSMFKDMNADYPYEIYVTSNDGTEYELIYAIADNDYSMAQLVSNQDNHIIIPKELKENKYAVPVIYLREIVEEDKIYSLETYPFVYNERLSRYVSLKEGSMEAFNSKAQEQSLCTIVGDEDAGYSCSLYKIRAGDHYSLSVNGEEYVISRITATNDEGEKVILTNTNQLQIPRKFIEGDYLVLHIYLSQSSSTPKEYTVENYAFLDDADGAHVPINEGTLVFTNTATGEALKCDIDHDGEYCFMKNVKENTSYQVTIEGTSYQLTSFVALDESGSYQIVSDLQGNIKIPMGYRSDDYVVTKSFFTDAGW